MAEISCKWCGDNLNVGDEEKAVVALCMNGPMRHNREGQATGRSISTCDIRQWGAAATRFDYGNPADPSHVIQTRP